MTQYQATVPGDSLVKPDIQSFFETFYEISDTSDAHEKYSEQFTKGAKLVMASNEANGRDGMPRFTAPFTASFLLLPRQDCSADERVQRY